jgi:hypothetical protein
MSIVKEMVDQDAQSFLKQANHSAMDKSKLSANASSFTDMSKVSGISKCPFMTRHYADMVAQGGDLHLIRNHHEKYKHDAV